MYHPCLHNIQVLHLYKWGRMRAKGHRSWGHDTNSTSVNQHKRLKPWNPMCVCALVCVCLSREAASLSITAYQVTALPWPALRGLCCHTQEDLVSGSKPLSCQDIHSSLASTWTWCERLVGISIHTKGRLIYIPLNSTCCLTLKPWEALQSGYLHWALQINRPEEGKCGAPCWHASCSCCLTDSCIIWAASMLRQHVGQVSVTHCLQSHPSLLTRMADGGQVLCMCWGSIESALSAHV